MTYYVESCFHHDVMSSAPHNNLPGQCDYANGNYDWYLCCMDAIPGYELLTAYTAENLSSGNMQCSVRRWIARYNHICLLYQAFAPLPLLSMLL